LMFNQPKIIRFKKQFYKSNFLVKQKTVLRQGSLCLVSRVNFCVFASQLKAFAQYVRRASKKQAKI
jgi:hypothetical protein